MSFFFLFVLFILFYILFHPVLLCIVSPCPFLIVLSYSVPSYLLCPVPPCVLSCLILFLLSFHVLFHHVLLCLALSSLFLSPLILSKRHNVLSCCFVLVCPCRTRTSLSSLVLSFQDLSCLVVPCLSCPVFSSCLVLSQALIVLYLTLSGPVLKSFCPRLIALSCPGVFCFCLPPLPGSV